MSDLQSRIEAALTTRNDQQLTADEYSDWLNDNLREVQLEHLLEEFEAAHKRWCGDCFEFVDSWFGTENEYYPHGTPDEWVAIVNAFCRNPNGDTLEVLTFAARYIIARDFNEFDPQRADVLWKLQKQ